LARRLGRILLRETQRLHFVASGPVVGCGVTWSAGRRGYGMGGSGEELRFLEDSGVKRCGSRGGTYARTLGGRRATGKYTLVLSGSDGCPPGTNGGAFLLECTEGKIPPQGEDGIGDGASMPFHRGRRALRGCLGRTFDGEGIPRGARFCWTGGTCRRLSLRPAKRRIAVSEFRTEERHSPCPSRSDNLFLLPGEASWRAPSGCAAGSYVRELSGCIRWTR
jgi:hypothetical protein